MKYLQKSNPKTVFIAAGYIFLVWVLLLFIRSSDVSNKKIVYVDDLLYRADTLLFDAVRTGDTIPSNPALHAALEEVMDNPTLAILAVTMSDGNLGGALANLRRDDSIDAVNANLRYIYSVIKTYKTAQFESMTQLFFLYILLVLLSTLISSFSYIENHKQLLERDKQAEFSRRLSEMLESERTAISLELHDDLAQKLSIVKHHFFSPETDAPHSEILKRYMTECIGTVRQLSQKLRSPQLSLCPLHEQLRLLFSDFSGSSPIVLDFQMTGMTSLDCAENARLHLYRIVQELLSNCRRHSRADTVSVKLLYSHPVLTVFYRDDGIGYDPASVARGLGLNGIRLRLDLLGGTLTDLSKKDSGSEIKIEVKL